MDDKLQGAVDVLLEELEEQEKQSAETKRMINGLMRRMGKPAMFEDAGANDGPRFRIRGDEYYTKPLATAVQSFLQRRREPATAQEIFRGLVQGGFEFKGWKEEDRLRLLASSIGKNTKSFHKLPGGNSFGLVEWYDLETDDDKEPEPKPSPKKDEESATKEIPEAEGKSTGKEKSEK